MTIAFLQQPVLVTCAIIGIVTFLLSSAGVLLGGALGSVVGKRAEMLGGLMLIGLGCKILMEHQFFERWLSFFTEASHRTLRARTYTRTRSASEPFRSRSSL